MNFTKHFLLLLILASRPLCGNEAITEQFMQECGLKLLKPSDFKAEDQEFFEFSHHTISEAARLYHEHKISDLIALSVIVLTQLAQKIKKIESPVPHNPKNAHNLVAIANYKLEKHCFTNERLASEFNFLSKNALNFINSSSERNVETYVIGFYANIYNDSGRSDLSDLWRLHWYYQMMHPYEKESTNKDSLFFNSAEKIKSFRQLSLIMVKTLLITFTIQDIILYGIPNNIRDTIYQWNNNEHFSLDDNITTVARYIRDREQKDFDLFLWNLFGDQLIQWETLPCKGCETCDHTESIALAKIAPPKLRWLPRWILKRLY